MQVSAVQQVAGQDSATDINPALRAQIAAELDADHVAGGNLFASSLFAAVVVAIGFAAFLHLLFGEWLARLLGRYGGWAIVALAVAPGIAAFIAIVAIRCSHMLVVAAIACAKVR